MFFKKFVSQEYIFLSEDQKKIVSPSLKKSKTKQHKQYFSTLLHTKMLNFFSLFIILIGRSFIFEFLKFFLTKNKRKFNKCRFKCCYHANLALI